MEIADRVALACEVCRKRKRKCDGVTPTCSWCLQRNIACLYVPERPKKPKYDRNYVSGLETQIELLKEEVRRLKGPGQAIPLPQAQHTPDDAGQASQEDSSSGSKNDSAINDVSSLMWKLKIGDNGENTFIGPSGNFCFSTNLTEPSTQPCTYSTQGGAGFYNLDAHAGHLVSLFSQYINPIFQFLDARTLESIGSSGLQESDLLTSSILAAGSLYAEDTSARAYGDMLASKIESSCLETCRRAPNVATIQSLAIMCWRELGLGHENMAWMYNSMACSLSIHLGLTVTSLRELRQVEQEGNDRGRISQDLRQRTRTLWSVLLLDRIATSLLGRHCIIPWRRVQAPYLRDVLGDAATSEEISFDFQCRLWFLHDQYMDRIYSFEFNGLTETERHQLLVKAREELLSFRVRLQDCFDLKETSMPAVIFCHMAYHMSQLLIHRPYLNDPAGNHARQVAERTTTLESTSMVELIRKYQKIGYFDKVPLFVVHSVQTAAISLLLDATSEQPTVRSQSINRFRTCVDALESMGSRWFIAKRAITALRELAERWKIVIALPMRYSGPLERSKVMQTAPGFETTGSSVHSPFTASDSRYQASAGNLEGLANNGAITDFHRAEPDLFESSYMGLYSSGR